jgi:hypothetical protein
MSLPDYGTNEDDEDEDDDDDDSRSLVASEG